MQIIIGPRQVGKTTAVKQALQGLDMPAHYASADQPSLRDHSWIQQQWDVARLAEPRAGAPAGSLLVLDEVQKIPGWSEAIKVLWDAETGHPRPLKLVLLGSSALLIRKGMADSLAGRFELIHMRHWSFDLMQRAFGWNLDQYIYFGGYPGAAPLIDDELRWRRYVVDALIETAIARDVLLMSRIDKPALLRQLFVLGCAYSSQIMSYQKLVGQLQDAGNTTTLAHYLELLGAAGLLTGLQKYAGGVVRRRKSSPKLQVLNNALLTAQTQADYHATCRDRETWARLVESAVGAHLLNTCAGSGVAVHYWRDRGREVDFVLQRGVQTVAIEVKSHRRKASARGMDAFAKIARPRKQLLVGGQGIPLERFLRTPAPALFDA